MKPEYQPEEEGEPEPAREPALIDPEAYDASEQQFAASLEAPSATLKPAERHSPGSQPPLEETTSAASAAAEPPASQAPAGSADSAETIHEESATPDLWRQELAERLTQYRARRRPRAPRYPSLQLKFEPYEPALIPKTGFDVPSPEAGPRAALPLEDSLSHATETARILEFPRSSLMPPGPLEELAEPVFLRPRILEVPETPAPPPALGGISLEPEEPAGPERRPGIEIPLQPAPFFRRLLAAAVDGLLVLLALAAAGEIFYRIAGRPLPSRSLLLASAVICLIFWAIFQYLLLIYAQTTPGLWLARLHLSRFDGASVPRRIRRWRVLASLLSGVSLGLGYAWCIVDEDGLCWHDRITRTFLAPLTPNSQPDRAAE